MKLTKAQQSVMNGFEYGNQFVNFDATPRLKKTFDSLEEKGLIQKVSSGEYAEYKLV